jgi:hypothetical protein
MSFANKSQKKIPEKRAKITNNSSISDQFNSKESLSFYSTTASNECILLSFSSKNPEEDYKINSKFCNQVESLNNIIKTYNL